MRILTLDIGGSSVKSGVYDTEKKTIIKDKTCAVIPIKQRTIASLESSVLKAVSYNIKNNSDIRHLGISTTGSVSTDSVVVKAGHFDGYENYSWENYLSVAGFNFDTVHVENDGRASAWAEFSALNDDDCSTVHLVLGTGIGSSSIVNGKLVRGDFGRAGYLGHIIVSEEKTIICSCGRTGCIETIASAPGITAIYKQLSGDDEADFVKFRTAYNNADNYAVDTVKQVGSTLGEIAAIAMNILNPTQITIGGGVALAFEAAGENSKVDWFLNSLRQTVSRRAHRRVVNDTEIKYGCFGNDGGMIGAALLLKKALA